MVRLSFGPLREPEDGTLPPPPGVPRADGQGAEENPATAKPRGRPKGSTNKRTSAASLETLEGRLREKIEEDLLGPMSLASPLAAQNIANRLDRNVRAAMRIAAKNPAVKKSLEKIIDGSDYFTLAMFGLSTAACCLVDYGMWSATSPPARAAGIPKLWEEVYPDDPLPERTSEGSGRIRRGLYAEVADEEVPA